MTGATQPALSVPVIWLEDGSAPLAGRLDVFDDRLHLDGGHRDERRTRDLPLTEVESVRIGRANGDRINGRQTIVLRLLGGGELSLAVFSRPGTLIELAHRLEAQL